MSSLRLALKQSLLESSNTPCIIATPSKRKPVPIITPAKENISPPASRKKNPPQQCTPPNPEINPLPGQDNPPHANTIFSNIKSLSELASKLQVPEKSLYCVELSIEQCTVQGCLYKAAKRNGAKGRVALGPRCVVHNKAWYPKESSSTNNRGHFLIGPEYLRQEGVRTSCCCDDATCRGIGYSKFMARFPKSLAADVILAITVTGEAAKNKIRNDSGNCRIAPWHFDPEHRYYDEKEKSWRLKDYPAGQAFRDSDGKYWYGKPPPRYPPKKFKDDEASDAERTVLPKERWRQQRKPLPAWINVLSKLERTKCRMYTPIKEAAIAEPPTPVARTLPSRRRRVLEDGPLPTPPTPLAGRKPSYSKLEDDSKAALKQALKEAQHWKKVAVKTQGDKATMEKRALRDIAEKDEENRRQAEAIQQMIEQLQNEVGENQTLRILVEEKDNQLKILGSRVEGTEKELREKQELLKLLEKQRYLSYEDLAPGGRLADHVGNYTFFQSYESNNEFLEALNWDEEDEKGGLCENLRRYSKVTRAERQGEKDPPNDMKIQVEKRKLSWKDEWLIFNVYCHVGMTQEAICPLFGLKSASTVSDIVHGWTILLNNDLSLMFPTPSRSQMLRAYPARLIRAFGHAGIFMNLDASEVETEKARNKNAHAAMYSDYKGRDTIKYFAGCGPIGETFDGSLAYDGNCGSLSDSLGTRIMKLLDCVPFGHAVNVDKGFLIDNQCAEIGIGCVRPPKKLKKQVQQSPEDTGHTQKVGNTRIVVEQVNGGTKMSCRYFNGTIPILQLGLAPKILRVCYLLQNFHPALIHGQSMEGTEDNPRPCRAHIRWYGATDEGLADVRGVVNLWGSKREREHFADLVMQHPDIDTVEIGEMVLAHDWPTIMRQQHIEIGEGTRKEFDLNL